MASQPSSRVSIMPPRARPSTYSGMIPPPNVPIPLPPPVYQGPAPAPAPPQQQPRGPTLQELIYNAEIIDQVQEVGKVAEDAGDKDTIDPHGSVLLKNEEVPPGYRKFASNLFKSFQICQRLMAWLGRLPIISHLSNDHAVIFEYNYATSLRGLFFFISFATLITMTVMSTINLVSTMLNFPPPPDNETVTRYKQYVKKLDATVDWEPIIPVSSMPAMAKLLPNQTAMTRTYSSTDLRAEEMFVFRRNLASLLMILFQLYHIIVCDWNLFSRRHFLASYLTFWTESVEIMRIDAAGEANKYCKRFLLYYLTWFSLFFVANVANFAPVSSGAPTSLVFVWIRSIFPAPHRFQDNLILTFRIIGSVVYLYIILCSKVYVFFFLYICKILTTTCKVWNERLEVVFTKEERKKTRQAKCESRTGYDHLFKDYVNILDLVGGADALFQNILESYFAMTLLSIVFEVYNLVRPISGSQTEFKAARTLDMGIIALYLFNSLMIFYLVSSGAAEVGTSAADGLEIIRRQGILGHRSDEEMHFMISLYMSYTGHFDTSLSGGGYFILNKPFLIGIAGAMMSYIIIIFQFQPALGLSNSEQKALVGLESEEIEDIYKLRSLIFHVEFTFQYFVAKEPGY